LLDSIKRLTGRATGWAAFHMGVFIMVAKLHGERIGLTTQDRDLTRWQIARRGG
jgi:hypothetical protein